MENRFCALCIAPYEGMKALMSSLAEEYPEMDLTLFVGDRELGLEIAQANFHGNYDVVISRGDTAAMLRRDLSLPVVEIEVTMYDLLCALRLAGGLDSRPAFIAAPNIAESARQLCEVMGEDMDIHTYESRDGVEPVLLELQRNHCQTVLCDTLANTTAKRLGMNSFLVTSSLKSLRKAFDQALLICRSQRRRRDENLFFRELIQGQISQTVVFDSRGNLFLSTLSDPAPELLDMLRQELPESRRAADRRITRNLGGMLYSIRARQIDSGSVSCVAFFVDARRTPLSPSQAGIRFSTRPEAESAFYDSIFSFAGTIGDFQEEILRINQSSAPVMVTGEDGTGKESMVGAPYLRSVPRNHPFVSVNCSLLNDKSWTFLLEHHNSPLSDEGNTLYFASIDVLSPERQRQMLAALRGMGLCRGIHPRRGVAVHGQAVLPLFVPAAPAADGGPDSHAGQSVPELSERGPPPAHHRRGAGRRGAAPELPVAPQLHPVPPGPGGSGGHPPGAEDHRGERPPAAAEGAPRGRVHPPRGKRHRAPGPEPDAERDRPGRGPAGRGGDGGEPHRRRQTPGNQPHHAVAAAEGPGVLTGRTPGI